jgi:hypothetical protein
MAGPIHLTYLIVIPVNGMIAMEMVLETIYWVSKATNARIKLATALWIGLAALIRMEMGCQIGGMLVPKLQETVLATNSDVRILIWMDGAT